MLFKSLLAVAAATLTQAADLPSIEVVGNKFFYSNNGSQFYLKGIAYQEDVTTEQSTLFTDPLADADACKRDIPYFQELDTNVLRVYAVNASVDHDDCMLQLADAGIYVILDLSEPNDSINRDSPSWTLDLYTRYTDVVDAFHNYTNVLGFFAGNEVTNNASNTDASAFVKAAVRDTKAYIKDQGYRTIPVGYSLNDDEDTRVAIADYFACGDEDERADFFGINMYEWCGKLTFASSGYKDRTEDFQNLSIPIFFSEYGCNEVTPRLFQEVGTLYGSDMTDVWSGGIVYMYFEEANNYGLVSLSGSKVSTLTDFNNLKTQIASISPSSALSAAVASTATTIACPVQDLDWLAATELPPTPEKSVCDCLAALFDCVVSSDTDSKDYPTLFSQVCGYIDCSAITANGTTGEYGAYSFCSSKDQLLYMFNAYYHSQKQDSSACDFNGAASINSAATLALTCSSVASSVSAAATASGSKTAGATTTGTRSGSGSGASSASGSSSSKGAAAGTVNLSGWAMGSALVTFVVGVVSVVV